MKNTVYCSFEYCCRCSWHHWCPTSKWNANKIPLFIFMAIFVLSKKVHRIWNKNLSGFDQVRWDLLVFLLVKFPLDVFSIALCYTGMVENLKPNIAFVVTIMSKLKLIWLEYILCTQVKSIWTEKSALKPESNALDDIQSTSTFLMT